MSQLFIITHPVDTFNYLKSYLESTAAAGLTLTLANYAEAIATLKKRYSTDCEQAYGQLAEPTNCELTP